ncbi:MAG: hypothetical protein BGO29_04500 [Bacteroidales bacterium 36-12]|nr:MAG: hypothetical protein BGO29_04500 [Bacteroidales bacterium 36-12]
MKKRINQNQLKDWLDSLTVLEYPIIRKEIIDKCKITEQKFRHWKAGNSRVPVLAQEIINEIAGKAVFN